METTDETTTETGASREVVTVERLNAALARFALCERVVQRRYEEFTAADLALDRARAELEKASGEVDDVVNRARVQGGVR